MLDEKTELAKADKEKAELVVNNALINGLSATLREKQQYGLTFPADYNPTNALMGAYLVLKDTTDNNKKPVLESCTTDSIQNSLLNMVTAGLSVDKKQGYFIAYGGKLQFQKSYFGNVTIARRYGLKSINAEVIYEDDKFKMRKEDAKTVIESHEQDFINIDNDKIIGAYAVAVMQDGEKIAEVMNITQLRKAWAQRPGGLKEDAGSTHVKFRDQMAKKTVMNRLLKAIVNTHGDGHVSDTYDELEALEHVDMVSEDVQHEVQQNANTEEFEPDDIVVKPTELPEDDEDLPDFMRG